ALGVMGDGAMSTLRPIFLYAGAPVAIMVAVYTAFLFAQAEGRDLWQSPLLPFHLLVQAMMVGAGMLLFLDLLMPLRAELIQLLRLTFGLTLVVDLFITLVGEFGMPHASEIAARAAHDITHGNYKDHFWRGSVILGHLVPFVLLLLGLTPLSALAGLCAIAGLYFFEYAFVMAPQDVSNS
ncbi:MAG: polysulfide reductase NrfD, partial [Caldilineaceae bacterium]|nr:polysulfide reductase NrfD [Caldilineaceae bacterium]